jgi:hypothetical protein
VKEDCKLLLLLYGGGRKLFSESWKCELLLVCGSVVREERGRERRRNRFIRERVCSDGAEAEKEAGRDEC